MKSTLGRDLARAFNTFERTPLSVDWSATIEPTPRGAGRTGRAGIDSITSTTGAPFVTLKAGPFIDMVRARTGALAAATWAPGVMSGSLGLPKLTGDAAGQWVPENPVAPITPHDLTTTTVSLTQRTFIAGLIVSRQAIFSAAANFGLENVLVGILGSVAARAIERAAIAGTGSGDDQPLGLLANSSVPTLAIGDDGGPLTIAHLAAMEEVVALANADREAAGLAFHTTPQVRRYGRSTEGFSGAGALWTDQNTLIGLPAFASSNTPSDLTKGEAEEECSAIVFGAWQDLLIGLFGPALDVVIDPFAKKRQGMVEIAVSVYADVAPLNNESFIKTLDVTTPIA